MERLLHGVHDVRLDRVDVGGEVLDEVVLAAATRSPASSMLRCASAGVGAPCAKQAPIDSPSSSPKAAM